MTAKQKNKDGAMGYTIDCKNVTLPKILERIHSTDLVPSLTCLKTQAEDVLERFRNAGVHNLEEVRKFLSTKKRLSATGTLLQVDENILVLFKREIEGWIAKERPLDEFDWIPAQTRNKLKIQGIVNSREVFNQLGTPAFRKAASKQWNIEQDIMDDLFALSSLLRIRWLSPSFTRIFHDLQHTVATLQHAQADRLTKQIDECNKTKKYYKGKVGERDINRIIHESRYVED